jgi:hypothetical protein
MAANVDLCNTFCLLCDRKYLFWFKDINAGSIHMCVPLAHFAGICSNKLEIICPLTTSHGLGSRLS